MDNYKIKVKDEAESKEAQELFFELGYEWRDSKRDITNLDVVFIYAKDGVLTAGFNDHNFAEAGHKELTIPQLRDLVVLKRNDVKDATHTHNGCAYYVGSDLRYTFDQGGWHLSAIEMHLLKPIHTAQAVLRNLDELREEYKDYHKDPALISGAEAKLAWANGEALQINKKDTHFGFIDMSNDYSLGIFDNEDYEFRLKPQTIKVELEIPAPFQPKEGEECCYISDESIDGYHTVSYNSERYSGMIFGLYRPSDIEKVVALFRSAFGGAS